MIDTMYLPLPPVYHDCSRRDWPTKHTSTPLAHRIITDKPPSSILSQSNCRPSAWFPGTGTLPRPSFAYGNDVGKLNALPSAPELSAALASPIPRKGVASILPPLTATRQERTPSSSSSSSRGSIQFCICKPAVKPPRPSNCRFPPFLLFFFFLSFFFHVPIYVGSILCWRHSQLQ